MQLHRHTAHDLCSHTTHDFAVYMYFKRSLWDESASQFGRRKIICEMPDFVLEDRMCSAGDSSDLNEWKPASRVSQLSSSGRAHRASRFAEPLSTTRWELKLGLEQNSLKCPVATCNYKWQRLCTTGHRPPPRTPFPLSQGPTLSNTDTRIPANRQPVGLIQMLKTNAVLSRGAGYMFANIS